MSQKIICVFLLSEKSSGSSLLFRYLRTSLNLKKYPQSRHEQHETLFWTKAASVLMKPQLDMLGSEVPIPAVKARQDLESFLGENLNEDFTKLSDDDLIFNGWYKLLQKYGPVFIEKSPHHLMQMSAINLMLEFAHRYRERVSVKFIGLVRNPYDTACSQFRRWGIPVNAMLSQWRVAYSNLITLKEQSVSENDIYLLRYEEFIRNPNRTLETIRDFIGVVSNSDDVENEPIKDSKSAKSRQLFGFSLDKQTIDLAKSLGYSDDEMISPKSSVWPCYRIYISFIRAPLAGLYRLFS